MARLFLSLAGGVVCGLGITTACGLLWLYFGGETFADHFVHF